jgi:hypothetical protein
MSPAISLNEASARGARYCAIAALLGIAGAVGGVLLDPAPALRSYLIAFVFWLGLSLGALVIVMLHNVVGGGWGFVVRRLLETAMTAMPLFALLFVPIVVAMPQIYEWAGHHGAEDPALLKKAWYLNTTFFVARAIIYFAIWSGLAWVLDRWSLAQDKAPTAERLRRMQQVSGVGILIYAVTLTFAVIDWIMSITPHWYSHVFGMLFMVVQVLAALAFGIVVATYLAQRRVIVSLELPKHFHDLGTLLFAFVMLWAYLMFSQLLIIWSGNIPEETIWYALRSHGAWLALGIALGVFHFAAPFLVLLSRRVKQTPRLLASIAGALVLLGFADIAFLVSPLLELEMAPLHWTAPLAWLGLGGLWGWLFLRHLPRRPILPLGDPRVPRDLMPVVEVQP